MLKRLNKRQLALLKLSIWSAMLTFMAFLLVFGFVGLRIILDRRDVIYEGYWYSGIMHWVLPIWFIFVILIVIVLMARYTGRKLSKREPEEEDGTGD